MTKDNIQPASYQNESNDEKPVLPAVSLLPHLDKWISDCDKQAEKFRNLNMPTSEISAQAMAYAYSIVKLFIKENYGRIKEDSKTIE